MTTSPTGLLSPSASMSSLVIAFLALTGVGDCHRMGRRSTRSTLQKTSSDSVGELQREAPDMNEWSSDMSTISSLSSSAEERSYTRKKTAALFQLHDVPKGLILSTAVDGTPPLHAITPTRLPVSQIYVCLKLAGLAYFDEPLQINSVPSTELMAPPIFNPKIWNSTGVDAHVVVWVFNRSRTVVVTYRGTWSTKDLRADLKTRLVPAPREGMVHAGFMKYYSSTKQWLQLVLADVGQKTGFDKIVFTGHSLGGAQATLAAADATDLVNRTTVKKVTCITFGSPRVGDADFARAFNSAMDNSLRVVFKNDVVSRLFTSRKYVHVGPAHVFSADGSWVDEPDSLRHRKARALRGRIMDHRLKPYVTALTRAVLRSFGESG